MSDLTPNEKTPGLHISAEPIYRRHDDPGRWWQSTATAPKASYHCGGCGKSESATGNDAAGLIDDYKTNHGPAHNRGRRS
ncbi:hypothetical protein [Streptomyces sp. NPDC001480]|uniref:hypothetical protein n=1 Tax=Streptomyces sp. NPDC001480 TaxID=3364577 RepID=UPI0036847668